MRFANFILLLPTLFDLTSATIAELFTVRRCCPFGQKLDLSNLACVNTPKEWKTTVVSNDLQHVLDFEEVLKTWKVLIERPSCKNPQTSSIPKIVLLENGTLWLKGDYITDGKSFCMDDDLAILCGNEDEASSQTSRIYINKCCDNETIISVDSETPCVDDVYRKSISLSQLLFRDPGLADVLDPDSMIFEYGPPHCDEGTINVGHLGKFGARLLPNGSLVLPKPKTTLVLHPRTFCIDWVAEDSIAELSPAIFICPSHVPAPENSTEYEDDIRFTVYPLGLILSVICLTLTLAAGTLMPSSHHLLHWRCQTCHVACLLVGDLLLAIVQLSRSALPSCICSGVASVMHFFFLSAFFWLNTMCFNIWWTFRDIRPSTLDKRQESVRLRIYNAYAWGVPSLITITAILMDRMGDESLPAALRPQFGVSKCWFYGESEMLTYFYGPIGVLLFLNVMLFSMTTWELTCGLWKREVGKTTSERAALGRVCWKLVVVMGITWIADIISWLVGGPDSVWYPTDIINTLQGVFIFIVVACQPQVLAALKRLWCPSTLTTTSANGHHQHSSSQDVPSLNDSLGNTNTTGTKSSPDETIC